MFFTYTNRHSPLHFALPLVVEERLGLQRRLLSLPFNHATSNAFWKSWKMCSSPFAAISLSLSQCQSFGVWSCGGLPRGMYTLFVCMPLVKKQGIPHISETSVTLTSTFALSLIFTLIIFTLSTFWRLSYSSNIPSFVK